MNVLLFELFSLEAFSAESSRLKLEESAKVAKVANGSIEFAVTTCDRTLSATGKVLDQRERCVQR